MTEAGPLGLISEDEEDEETGADIKLPGVRRGEGRRETVCVCGGGRGGLVMLKMTSLAFHGFTISGDLSSRKTRPEIRIKSIQFSPTGVYRVCANCSSNCTSFHPPPT